MSVAASIAVRAVLDDFEASFVCGRHASSGSDGTRALDAVCRAGLAGSGLVASANRAARTGPRHQPAVPGHRRRPPFERVPARGRGLPARGPPLRDARRPDAHAGSPRPAGSRCCTWPTKDDLAGAAALERAMSTRRKPGDLGGRPRPPASPWPRPPWPASRPTFTGAGFFVVGLARRAARCRPRPPGRRAALAGRRAGGDRPSSCSSCSAARSACGAGRRAPTAADTVDLLTDQVLFGWKDLLTTLPPVDGDGPLLVLPWALGLATGLVGGAGSRLASGPGAAARALPLLAPLALLPAVILLGVQRAAVAVAPGRRASPCSRSAGWPCVPAGSRHRCAAVRPTPPARRRRGDGRPSPGALACPSPPGRRATTTTAPGAAQLRRAAVRHRPVPLAARVVPPLRQAARKEPDPTNLYDEEIATVEGAPAGLPAADRHPRPLRRHGLGRRQRHPGGSSTDTFQRVSSVIDNPVEGEQVDGDGDASARATPASGCRRSARSSR